MLWGYFLIGKKNVCELRERDGLYRDTSSKMGITQQIFFKIKERDWSLYGQNPLSFPMSLSERWSTSRHTL